MLDVDFRHKNVILGILDVYLGNLEPYRFRLSALARSVPNIQQEQITRFLDRRQDEIKEWLDDRLTVNECHKIYEVPICFSPCRSLSWKDTGSSFPGRVHRRIFPLYIRRCKLELKAGEKLKAFSYAGITDYGHIILGRLRQEGFNNPQKGTLNEEQNFFFRNR